MAMTLGQQLTRKKPIAATDPGGHQGGEGGERPVGVASEVWAYEPVVSAEPKS